jgi:hypothetical protein
MTTGTQPHASWYRALDGQESEVDKYQVNDTDVATTAGVVAGLGVCSFHSTPPSTYVVCCWLDLKHGIPKSFILHDLA